MKPQFKNIIIVICVLVGGCCARTTTLQPIDRSAIASVQAEIKRQVGVYMSAARSQPPIDRSKLECGSGQIGFDISAIKAELTTTTDVMSDAKAGITIPVSSITFGPSAENKTDRMNTEVLDYNLWPTSGDLQNPAVYNQNFSDALSAAPLAKVLLDLRDALIDAAMKTPKGPMPCFTDYNPDKPASDAGNTFKMGLSFTTDTSGGVSIGVSMLNLSASGEIKSVTGNTLTVSFVQSDLAKIQYLKDGVDAECKYPNGGSSKCQQAKKKLADAMKSTGLGFR